MFSGPPRSEDPLEGSFNAFPQKQSLPQQVIPQIPLPSFVPPLPFPPPPLPLLPLPPTPQYRIPQHAPPEPLQPLQPPPLQPPQPPEQISTSTSFRITPSSDFIFYQPPTPHCGQSYSMFEIFFIDQQGLTYISSMQILDSV